MKTFITILLLALTHRAGAAFLSNPYTTNGTDAVDGRVTNIASVTASNSLNANLTTNLLSQKGALTALNFHSYADFLGAAFIAQNAAIVEAEGYTDASFAANPFNWISTAATNHITKFDTNVVTSVTLGTGLSGSTSLDASGYHVTIQATGTNNASITNLNATVLAQAGGLTTNNFGTYADPAGAASAATNGYVWSSLYDLSGTATAKTNGYPWGALYDPAGAANKSTNWGNIRFTNAPVIGTILLSSNMTVSFTTNGQGLVTATIGSIASASGTFQPAATNLYGWAGLSTNQVVIGTNIIGQIIGGTSILLSATTNGSGLVSVTINYTGTQIPQTGSLNLTNWSAIATNQVPMTTNLVTKITAGTGMTVTATTNSQGINYTVTQTTSPAVVRAGSFTAVAGGSGSVVFSSTMGVTPVVTLGPTDWGNSATGRSFVIITSTSATGFSWSDANDTSGINKTIYYIATPPQ